jgi:hypothetical protein
MLTIAGIIVVAAPLMLLAVFGMATLFRNFPDRAEHGKVHGDLNGLWTDLCVVHFWPSCWQQTNATCPWVLGDWVKISGAHAHDLAEPKEQHEHDAKLLNDAKGDGSSHRQVADSGTPETEAEAAGHDVQKVTSHDEGAHAPADGEESHSDHFHFRLKFVFDRLSVPFVIMTFVFVRRDRGVCKSLSPSRRRLSSLLHVLLVLPAGHDPFLRGRNH